MYSAPEDTYKYIKDAHRSETKSLQANNYFSACHFSPSTSMTVNTRAAMNIIQQMWESPLSQGIASILLKSFSF